MHRKLDLEQVFEAMIDGVIVVNHHAEIDRINGAARRILGLRGHPARLRGVAIESLRHADLFAAELQRCLAEGSSIVMHDLALHQDGAGDHWGAGDQNAAVVDVETVPILDDAARVEGAVLILRDATIGVSLREARDARHQDEVFGRMAAGIAHEVKNPLGGIRGAAELLARHSDDKRSLRRAELIMAEVDRIATLIDDFMVFTHDRLRLGDVNVHQVLDDVLSVMEHDRRSAHIRFERRFDPSIPELRADGDRLRQLFLNLVRNALDAMEGHPGTVRVSSRLRLDHRIDLEGNARGPSVIIDVEDEGCGIAAELRDQVGTPFFTTKDEGTGLGLALCRHFVAQHGGSLQLHPREERGTRVRVALPLRRPA